MLAIWWERYTQWYRSLSATRQWATVSVSVATIGGAVFRLTNLRVSMQFYADQGRDALIAYGILRGDMAFIGPETSVGDMYLGPLYYYFMAPWLWLTRLDPIGPALAVAVLGIMTVPLLYILGRRWVGEKAAVWAAMLYAVAPVAAEYTRFSWNPNLAPLVGLLLVDAMGRAWQGQARWWGVAGLWLAVILQLHYVAGVLAIPLGIYWVADLYRTGRGQPHRTKTIIAMAGVGMLSLALLWLPLALFDWRFNGLIRAGFVDFFNGSDSDTIVSGSAKLWQMGQEMHGRLMHILFEIWRNQDWTAWYRQLNTGLLGLYGLTWVYLVIQSRSQRRFSYGLLGVVLLTSALGLAWYRGTVFDHYVTFILPVSYLFTGVVINQLSHWPGVGKGLALALFSYILWCAVQPISMRYMRPLGLHLDKIAAVADKVVEIVPDDQTYSMASLSEVRDYRGLNYRYFLTISEQPPVSLEQNADADLLVVIAESPREPADIMNSPVYEINTFPKGEYHFVDIADGPRLYFISRQKVPTEALQPAKTNPQAQP